MTRRTALLVATASLQLSCYNYLPLHSSDVMPATYLAITLTDAGSEELAHSLGPNARVVRGRFLAVGERSLSLSVQAVESRRGVVARWAGETVVVPGRFVWTAEERRISHGKVALLAGASLLAVVVAYKAFVPSASGGTPASSSSGPGAQ